MKKKKLEITIHVNLNSLVGADFIFSLSVMDREKIKDKFGFTPANGINIYYDEKLGLDYYFNEPINKRRIENIFSLGNFTEKEVEFKWQVGYEKILT